MVKQGWVIKVSGDREIADAIKGAVLVTLPTNSDYNKLAVREVRERRYWQDKIEEARVLYGCEKPPRRLSRAFWGLVGLVVYKVDGLYKRLSEANRRG